MSEKIIFFFSDIIYELVSSSNKAYAVNSEQEKRPIILFGGLNGAGKTSIFSAITHCLYGKYNLDLK